MALSKERLAWDRHSKLFAAKEASRQQQQQPGTQLTLGDITEALSAEVCKGSVVCAAATQARNRLCMDRVVASPLIGCV